MNSDLIFLPVLTQILLTLWLYIELGNRKYQALKAGEVNQARRALHGDAWPDKVLQINNCIRNQFEVPVLFYVLVIILWSTNSINIAMHILAWCFAFSRIAHAVIHTGSNYVPLRRKVFMGGIVILAVISFFLIYAILRG